MYRDDVLWYLLKKFAMHAILMQIFTKQEIKVNIFVKNIQNYSDKMQMTKKVGSLFHAYNQKKI